MAGRVSLQRNPKIPMRAVPPPEQPSQSTDSDYGENPEEIRCSLFDGEFKLLYTDSDLYPPSHKRSKTKSDGKVFIKLYEQAGRQNALKSMSIRAMEEEKKKDAGSNSFTPAINEKSREMALKL